MKFLSAQFSYLLVDRQARSNLRSLFKLVVVLVAIVAVYTVVFHALMLAEGQTHSWLSGVYWVMVVMSTLGFGDITFESDVGRLFSVLVLLTGVVMLLIVLPFAFIRYFYAPYLEARIGGRIRTRLPEATRGHVIVAAMDPLVPGLLAMLQADGVPHVVVERDRAAALDLYNRGVPVVHADIEDREALVGLGADRARLVVANVSDAVNTSVALAVGEVAPATPVAAIVEEEDAVDVLELCGARLVLPLKMRLGEHLARRVDALQAEAHVIGRYGALVVAEVPLHHTPLVGQTVAESRLRQTTGLSLVGVWERGGLQPAGADTRLGPTSVAVVVGSQAQVDALNELLAIYAATSSPVLVVGGGAVGRAAVATLAAREVPVRVVDESGDVCGRLAEAGVETFCGDAADFSLMQRAGITEAPSVVLTTHDDATNIFLAAYCRRLNPGLRIVSRVSQERSLEALHRAGADFVLSASLLGVEAVRSFLAGVEPLVIGGGVRLRTAAVPAVLAGQTLLESAVGARTGLTVAALERGDGLVAGPPPDAVLPPDARLVLIGNDAQHAAFDAAFAVAADGERPRWGRRRKA